MKEKIKKYIAEGKTSKAVKELLTITKLIEDKDYYHEVLQISGRWEKLQREINRNIVESSVARIEDAKINKSLLSIIDNLPVDELEPLRTVAENDQPRTKSSSTSESKKKNKNTFLKKLGSIALVIGILAGLAEFSGYSLRDLIGKNKDNSFSTTVIVHGKQGKDDRILKNQGKVVLDIGGDRKEEDINKQGEARFAGLPSDYINKNAFISVEHPQPYLPVNRNREYKLEKNKLIYLEIELKGMNQIRGRVIDSQSEKPLDSVRVSIQNIAAYTDNFGWYELEIPEKKQSKFVTVNFYKEGYKMQNIDSIAPHTKQEFGIALQKN